MCIFHNKDVLILISWQCGKECIGGTALCKNEVTGYFKVLKTWCIYVLFSWYGLKSYGK